jgi:hypothetical protein
MQERFTSRYRGSRPEEIGVQLTEGFMMNPEASVSALVVHHLDAVYFTASVGKRRPGRNDNVLSRNCYNLC